MWSFEVKQTKQIVKIPESWNEITLGHYGKFIDATNKLKEKLEKNETIDTNLFDIVKNYRSEFNAMFAAFTGLNPSFVNKIKANNIINVYLHIRSFLEPPKPKAITSFKFKGTEYFLPKNKTDYFGNVLEFGEATFGEVVEAMQIQELSEQFIENNYLALPYQIAILCRPEGEQYDDQNISERSKMFNELPMSVVWDIAFFLIRHKNKSLNYLSQFLEQKQKVNQL